ncbi:tail protein X [Tepidibacter thalassicus]|uniref:Phage Tail Protein X n=1 Tax=Tepidibacter thalassicus DSM 15285 TaxID=1123350 RepID=A0A1M5NNG9_9FIRM|nr:tail protein X [Tepidibacter thalassicus]SHG90483.1 Phage Tail Protein X [Tepidibacter thalassicus DSM 15285]
MSKKYTTVLGDMWDTIAYKTLGDEKYTDKLIKNNLQHRHTAIFPAGIVIDIPEIEVEVSAKLPPWKRGIV